MATGIVTIPLAGSPLVRSGVAERRENARSRASIGYLAGPENRLAEQALQAPLSGKPTVYSPLFFYGPAGSGKTHLASGLTQWWEEDPRRGPACAFTGQEFLSQFGGAVHADRVEPWRSECRSAALFVLDDLAPLAGKRSAQQELCRTLDALETTGALVVITSRCLPGQISGLSPALVSRLSAGLATPLALPGAAARRAIVESLITAWRLPMTLRAAHLFADGVGGSAPALATALAELVSTQAGGEIDVEAAQAFLRHNSDYEPPTLRSIAVQTAKYFQLTLADLKSPLRRQALVTARGVAFVLARQLTDKSLEQIGDYFGGRDHTTVLHACRRTEKLAERDNAILQALADLKRHLTLA